MQKNRKYEKKTGKRITFQYGRSRLDIIFMLLTLSQANAFSIFLLCNLLLVKHSFQTKKQSSSDVICSLSSGIREKLLDGQLLSKSLK